MKKVLIVGGGLSGLSAACYLSHNKFDVTLIESTHKLGGKTFSFIDDVSNTEIDNGQHILLGCYTETLNLLKLISAHDRIVIQKNFSIPYLFENYRIIKLQAENYFYPLNLLKSFLVFPLLNFNDKFSLLKFMLRLRFIDSDSLINFSVKEWLLKESQTQNSISILWEVICVGALNTSTEKASAKIFCDILKQIFWTDENAYKIILPKRSLNDTFIQPIEKFLVRNKVKIYKSEKCDQIIISANGIQKIITTKRKFEDFDYYIFAIPIYTFKSLLVLKNFNLDFTYSPILNIYIWLEHNPLNESFYAVPNSVIHWIFNKGEFINITISNAVDLIDKPKSDIENIILNELQKFIPNITMNIKRILIVKEKKATFIPTKEIITKRPNTKTEIKNLFLAGDWTNTKLPATIEGAIKSGRIAAEEIIKKHFLGD